MRKIFLALCLVLCLSLPAFAGSWTLADDGAPFDPLLAESVQRWRKQHNWEFQTHLTEKQRRICRELVQGTLAWAYAHGNRFDSEEFLSAFNNRDGSVYVIRYPDGGLGFVMRGVYMRIQLDKRKPDLVPPDEIPEGGRWFAEIGCDSHSQLFYFRDRKLYKRSYLPCKKGSSLFHP